MYAIECVEHTTKNNCLDIVSKIKNRYENENNQERIIHQHKSKDKCAANSTVYIIVPHIHVSMTATVSDFEI